MDKLLIARHAVCAVVVLVMTMGGVLAMDSGVSKDKKITRNEAADLLLELSRGKKKSRHHVSTEFMFKVCHVISCPHREGLQQGDILDAIKRMVQEGGYEAHQIDFDYFYNMRWMPFCLLRFAAVTPLLLWLRGF